MKRLFFAVLFLVTPLWGAESTPRELKEVGIEEYLGKGIDLNLIFTNESGQTLPLKRYFEKGRPVVLALVYYECPNLCQFLIRGLNESLQRLDWNVGEKFEVVTVSINPEEDDQLAQANRESQLKAYGREGAGDGWHALVGQQANIKALAEQIGFRYKYDKEEEQYAHAAGLFILSPEGKISRVLYGVQFEPRDLKLALLEAAQGKIGTLVDRLTLYCYSYDPKTHRYSLFARNLMKLGGLVTVVFLAVLVGGFWWRGREKC
ncbi:MAG: SCO family protein [bacterium]|nr:SCO family protein [bacterium]